MLNKTTIKLCKSHIRVVNTLIDITKLRVNAIINFYFQYIGFGLKDFDVLRHKVLILPILYLNNNDIATFNIFVFFVQV